jgi:hypothetical protein
MQMLGPFEAEFQTKADLLGLGLGALEVFRLRRVSYTTGRYVPVYRDREIDDPRWPERLYPPIPWGIPPSQNDKPGWAVVEEITGTIPAVTRGALPVYNDLGQGWTSLGTRGDWP